MKYKVKILRVAAATSFIFWIFLAYAQTPKKVAPQWLKEQPFSYSIKESNEPNAEPRYEFEWRKSDWDAKRRTKGTELKSAPMLGIKQQWVAFKFYLPSESFIDDKKFTIIMQYHGIPDFDLGEKWRNPISDLLVRDGKLQYDFRASSEPLTPGEGKDFHYSRKGSIKLGAPKFDAWNEIIFHQNFDYDNGSIKIWINNALHERKKIGIGFNDKSGMFFKFGLYCPQSSDKQIKRIMFQSTQLYSDDEFTSEAQALASIEHDLRS